MVASPTAPPAKIHPELMSDAHKFGTQHVNIFAILLKF
jgi:hypothetical protein